MASDPIRITARLLNFGMGGMVANPIRLSTLVATIILVAAVELAAPWLVRVSGWPLLAVIGTVRSIEIVGMLGLIFYLEKGPAAIGAAPDTWIRGLKTGALWSIGFGLAAAVGAIVIYVTGRDPLSMVRVSMPRTTGDLILLFLVGGLIGPLAEEICFRGLFYTFFRRWGVITALVASTLLFVILHSVHGFPVIQIIGGIVFAVAFETSRNLVVPVVIHVLGNSAIFALSLFG